MRLIVFFFTSLYFFSSFAIDLNPYVYDAKPGYIIDPAHTLFLPSFSYQQTTSDSCGPAVVMTLLNYYGVLPSGQMNTQTERKISSEMHTNLFGTDQMDMVDWLKRNKFTVEWGYAIHTQDIISSLQKHQPVIIVMIDWSGHAVLVIGYQDNPHNSDQSLFFLANPSSQNYVIYKNKPIFGIDTVSKKEIEDMWVNAKYFFNPLKIQVGMYIIAKPG